ncbi:SNARE-associated Golgi protein [Pyrolobus fumarii 1A]|uniref:SNARE-associated Golgi protein n=1 Tax=Pyrolobus fumarii (strain DSM 11204 / 1A) TaxID=694429 RepID=G0EGE6_PYRF1|nr:SNARE-associated Golgi protein [Pyrolobus fumarii 1A]
MIEELVKGLWEAYSSVPWLGAFIVSLLGNAIPYTTVPYLVWIALTAPEYSDPLVKALVIVFAGLGAAIGKLIVFTMGRAAHAVLPEHVRENMEYFAKLIKKWGFLAIFLFAALPLPDDILYIPLGIAGYSITLFFIAVALGKIVITALAVMTGDILASMTGAEGGFNAQFILALLVLSFIVTYVIARIDWMRVTRAMEEGIIPAMVVLLEETGRALLPVRRGSGKRGA